MPDCPDILISLFPAYTKAILDGRKTVELRRRRIRADKGTRVWFYSKSPTARVEGSARIRNIDEATPKNLWSKYAGRVGISKNEFDDYFRGCDVGYAIVLDKIEAASPGVDLALMRDRIAGFHPPQFFKRLHAREVRVLLQAQ